jgi:exodeoxyribonuclease V beta subunit
MKKTTSKILDSATIPLSGRHLIEASAGTGKTYNITRIYLRLLLEKKLNVQQILVMTFTKAATEELRGRIDEELRIAIRDWGSLGGNDAFFKLMENRFTKEQAQKILKPALLELDEASIYTIHGFCSRALSSQSFVSGLAMDISMEADSSELLLESIRDWLRKINQNTNDFTLLAERGWHQPEEFLKQFYRALTTSSYLETVDASSLQNYFDNTIDVSMAKLFTSQKSLILETIKQQQKIIFDSLVLGKKDENKRRDEWQQLIHWLSLADARGVPKELTSFINGNRYRGNEPLKEIFQPLKDLKTNFTKQLKKFSSDLDKQIKNAPIYQLACQGINEIRGNFAQEKLKQAVMDFDDLISYLSKRLQTEEGKALIKALQYQYPVALVDEFQDTDPDQYAIFDKLYPSLSSATNYPLASDADKTTALFMIGDPKQAIYAFRGGDIFTYLSAKKGADYHWYMDTNWRSLAGVITAYNRLFWGKSLDQKVAGDIFGYGIGYEKINPTSQAKANKTPLIDSNKQFASLNYCLLDKISQPSGSKGDATTDDWKNGLAQWSVIEISRLLAQSKLGNKPLQERHIAILVRTGAEAKLIRNELEKSGFPAVYLSAKESIFKTEQAEELLTVLRGILECENNKLLLVALSSYLMGGNAAELASYNEKGDEQAWEEQRDRAIKLRDLWFRKGCMTMIMKLISDDYQPQASQHERSLTNMIHLAELLQQASQQYQHPQQLVKWFADQCHNETLQDESQLRLESDANLIRIITQHGCKGLEYPIVFIPFASAYRNPVRQGQKMHDYFEYHDVDTYQPRHLIGQSWEAIQLTSDEVEAESIRLLYVAITRAAHRCYLGIAPFINSSHSALGLSLQLSNDNSWQQALEILVSSSDNSSALIAIDDTEKTLFERIKHIENNNPLLVSTLLQPINNFWSLSSFSNLTRDSYKLYQQEKDRVDIALEGLTDEGEAVEKLVDDQALRFTIRKGINTGKLLHDILEQLNFSADRAWQIEIPIQRFGGIKEEQRTELVEWLEDCLETPLPAIGAETQAFKLSDLSWSQTLRETEFYFPLQAMQINSLINCLKYHRGDNKDIFLPNKEELTGMMKGYIDLIFEHNGRFYIVDYKSSHLGNHYEDYHWQALKENNQHHFYDLQYLIYSLALHRFLQSRIADYDPQSHFGGVYYLYLRAMSQNNEQAYGVYHCSMDDFLLEQLDQVFRGEVLQDQKLEEEAL